ncbi:unnamed protein product [Cunninghamella echinulata]
MKFTLVIAALFATSAIAAPCGKGHHHDDGVTTVPDQVKVPADGNNQEQNAKINTGNGPITGGDASHSVVAAPVTVPVNVEGVNAANNLLANLLGNGPVTNSDKKTTKIDQDQQQNN